MSVLGPIRYVVRGRVQGVGFRWFVMQEAGRLDLEGYVRNLPDGSVEVVARGTQATLGELERALAAGPRGARVVGVEKEEISHDIKLSKPFDLA